MSLRSDVERGGLPTAGGGVTIAPFDILGDTLRGTKGVMLDMYRRPDTLLKACEKLLPLAFENGVNSAKRSGDRFVFIPLHKGLDGFMSPEQFKKFYWPTLRELMICLINEGLIPSPFWEGNCTSRLEYMKDIPAGKAQYRFEATDLMKAKDILRDRVCIRGNVPVSILLQGRPTMSGRTVRSSLIMWERWWFYHGRGCRSDRRKKRECKGNVRIHQIIWRVLKRCLNRPVICRMYSRILSFHKNKEVYDERERQKIYRINMFYPHGMRHDVHDSWERCTARNRPRCPR